MCRFEKVAAVVPGLNMADKYQRIAEYYSRLVSTIQRHYLLHKDNPPVAWNEPPLAGTGTDREPPLAGTGTDTENIPPLLSCLDSWNEPPLAGTGTDTEYAPSPQLLGTSPPPPLAGTGKAYTDTHSERRTY